jgi:hypothetical protein
MDQPLNILLQQLKAEFEKDETGSNVRILLQNYLSKSPVDWKKYCFFCDLKYARNLVEINEQFELMVSYLLILLQLTIVLFPSSLFLCIDYTKRVLLFRCSTELRSVNSPNSSGIFVLTFSFVFFVIHSGYLLETRARESHS